MLKKIFLLHLILFSMNILAQDSTTVTEHEDTSKAPVLVGFITREVFNDTSYSWWFNSEYNNYTVNAEDLDDVPSHLKDYRIIIILGTWCSDSRRETPRLLKILDSINFPTENIKLIAVDRHKKTSGNELEGLNIDLVPTFIFNLDGKEKGRIQEAPEETLETDIYNIVHSKN